MITGKRDNIIARQQRLIRLTFGWAVSSSVAVILLIGLSGYAFLSRPIKLVPMTGNTMAISDINYSPEYLLDSAKKILQLRLTFNPSTIQQQYRELVNVTAIAFQEKLKEKLHQEIDVVNHKEIASVFYVTDSHVDVSRHFAVISGDLLRSSHGIALTPEQKRYEVQFGFNGSLALQSIKEITNE